jgi:membrane-bound ClpP family serine protease
MASSMTGSVAFSKLFSWLGVAGNALMIVYLIFVTFIPSSGKFALVLAMPGGLLIMAWMVSFMVSIFKLASR